jgi:coenzyme F420-reducing hydrogenase alpha subunit
LSFFHLSSPDLLLGMDSDPSRRNIFALAAVEPELAHGGIRLRRFGQKIIEALGGQRIHPAWSIPGGVRTSLGDEDRAWIHQHLPEARVTILHALARYKELLRNFRNEVDHFGNFPTLFNDELMKKDNLLIATGQNNLAMNRAVLQVARHYVPGPKIPEGVLNRLEASIRAFDPCLLFDARSGADAAACAAARAGRSGSGRNTPRDNVAAVARPRTHSGGPQSLARLATT